MMPLPVTARGMLPVMSRDALETVGCSSVESESSRDALEVEPDRDARGAGAGAVPDVPDWDCVVCAIAGKPNTARTARIVMINGAFNRM